MRALWVPYWSVGVEGSTLSQRKREQILHRKSSRLFQRAWWVAGWDEREAGRLRGPGFRPSFERKLS